ncbi:MAG: ABC transporter substrate-binding protein [Halobacteriaceae archaeon]
MSDGETGADVDGRRRAFLAGLGAGGATALAGCLSGGDGAPVFRTFTPQPHERYDWTKGDMRADWPRLIYPYCFDRLGSENPDGTVKPLLAADWGHDGGEIRVDLKQSGWNNGDDVLAADWAMEYRVQRYALDRSPGEVADSGDPKSVLEATTAVEWDGRTARFLSDPGLYADLDVERWLRRQLTRPGPAEVFRHRSETRPLLDDVAAVSDPYSDAGQREIESLLDRRVSGDRADPTAALVSGPFEVSKLPPDRVEMTTNPHFRNADELNFERAEALVHSSRDVRWGGLTTGTYDAMPGILPPPPASAVESLPDDMRMHRWGGRRWLGLHANGLRSPELAAPRVRQALLYALDASRLADAEHEYAADPPSNPAGLTYDGAGRWMDDDLMASFQSYDYDPERAAELLRAEGFTKDGDRWRTPEGDRWKLRYLTASNASQFVSVLQGQLRDLGVETQVRSWGESTVSTMRSAGDFDLARRSWEGSPKGLFTQAMAVSADRHQFGIWTDERVREWAKKHDNVDVVEYEWTEKVEGFTAEQTKAFTVSAPPLGKPDSDERIDYPVVYMDQMLNRALSRDERREYLQKLAWVFNWTLPLLPIARTYNLAFQDHGEWEAPTDEAAWNRRDPTFHLLNMGRIRAKK